MPFDTTTTLVTGAKRGLRRHLVQALLDCGVRRVHAAARDVASLPAFGDRVSRLRLDLTDPRQIEAAAAAGHPPMTGYFASKAAAHPLTQSLRPALAERGITVIGAYPGARDTEMIAEREGPRADPREVADAILDGIEKGDDGIFPDERSRALSEMWFHHPKVGSWSPPPRVRSPTSTSTVPWTSSPG